MSLALVSTTRTRVRVLNIAFTISLHLVCVGNGINFLCRTAMVLKCGVPAIRLLRVLLAPLNQTSGLQGLYDGSCSDLAGNDLGNGSGWKQNKQDQTPLCSDEIRSRSTFNNQIAALTTQLHFLIFNLPEASRFWPRRLAYGSKSRACIKTLHCVATDQRSMQEPTRQSKKRSKNKAQIGHFSPAVLADPCTAQIQKPASKP